VVLSSQAKTSTLIRGLPGHGVGVGGWMDCDLCPLRKPQHTLCVHWTTDIYCRAKGWTKLSLITCVHHHNCCFKGMWQIAGHPLQCWRRLFYKHSSECPDVCPNSFPDTWQRSQDPPALPWLPWHRALIGRE
jgi:hypothetical protein